ncbi:MAG: alpha/beta hydrolase family protein, partial [Bacteroidia bacterium]
ALVKELVRSNFAVLNVNYRLVDATGLYDTPVKHLESAVKIKDQVADMGAVVNYAISKAKEWKISETKMSMAGHSAGATLALLYSYDTANTNKIKAVANLAGSLDQTFSDIPAVLLQFLPDYILEAGYRYTGYTVTTANDQYYRAISPLYAANAARKIPTLTVFPELNDVNGLPKQNRPTFDAFTTKLNSLGVPNKFVQIAGADHEFTGKFNLVLTETINYFNANL